MVKCYFCGVEIGLWEDGDAELLNETLPPAPTPDAYGIIERSNTVSEGSIDALSEDDVHMYQHQLYEQGGLNALL